MKNIEQLEKIFKQRFSDTGLKKGVFSAPGRVNLIGEHTDYNEGFVLPMAIEKEIVMIAQLRDDRKVRAYSLDYDAEVQFSLDELKFERENMWINYLKGVAQEIEKLKLELKGANLLFAGNIPLGSGLSSSAALEVVTAFTLANLNELEIKPVEMAFLCQQAENNFVGVKCGIMDQYISRLGRKNYALMIDCRSNEYELIPMTNEDYKVIICNSKIERGLVDSEYNNRRKECKQATDFFKTKLERKIKALRDVSLDDLNEFGTELPDKIFRRARHVITENNRVLTSVGALKNNDFTSFGKLMFESHQSLRDDYEVSCSELDLLVDLALKERGVLGARMTGAGFGGCTVNLVKKEKVEDFVGIISKGYNKRTGIMPEIYVTSPASGAEMISLG